MFTRTRLIAERVNGSEGSGRKAGRSSSSKSLAQFTVIQLVPEFSDCRIEFSQAEESPVPKNRNNPSFADLNSHFSLGFVPWSPGSRRHNSRTVMAGKCLVGWIDIGFVPAGFGYPGLKIIRDQAGRYSTHEVKGANMRPDPGSKIL